MIRVRMVPASPFVRKVRIATAYLGLSDRVRFVDSDEDSDDALRAHNPLNKVPVAVLDDGNVFYDSRVILEYLDYLAGGGRIIPLEIMPRMRALTMQSLGDGILDAAVLIGYESRFREPEQSSARWLEMQRGKVARGIAEVAKAPPNGPIHVGHISVACALGFIDLRLGGTWRKDHPGLIAWLDEFAGRVPAFEATRAQR